MNVTTRVSFRIFVEVRGGQGANATIVESRGTRLIVILQVFCTGLSRIKDLGACILPQEFFQI